MLKVIVISIADRHAHMNTITVSKNNNSGEGIRNIAISGKKNDRLSILAQALLTQAENSYVCKTKHRNAYEYKP